MPTPATKTSQRQRAFRQNLTGYLFAAPWFIGFFGLTLFPMIVSLLLSFVSWKGITLEMYDPAKKIEPAAIDNYIRWVGLDNYKRAWAGITDGVTSDLRSYGVLSSPPAVPRAAAPTTQSSTTQPAVAAAPKPTAPISVVKVVPDSNVWISLKNTAIYSFGSVPLGLCLSLFLALMLNQSLKGIGFFRTVYYMPNIIGGVATLMMWIWVFEPNFGLLNSAIRGSVWFLTSIPVKLGLMQHAVIAQPPRWLYDEFWAKPSLIIMAVWGAGGSMLIFLAALQSVPEQLYEAARIDGAGRLRQFWHVTLPQISPALFFNMVIGIIGSFQVFDSVYILTAPTTGTTAGPNRSLLMYVLYVYQKAFIDYEMGYASALAWVLFVVVLIFTLLIVRSARYWVYYEGESK